MILQTAHRRAGDHFVGEPSIDETTLTGARGTCGRKDAKRRAVARVAPESRTGSENGATLRPPDGAIRRETRELSLDALEAEHGLVRISIAVELRHVQRR